VAVRVLISAIVFCPWIFASFSETEIKICALASRGVGRDAIGLITVRRQRRNVGVPA
jgi:hypothetical protein